MRRILGADTELNQIFKDSVAQLEQNQLLAPLSVIYLIIFEKKYILLLLNASAPGAARTYSGGAVLVSLCAFAPHLRIRIYGATARACGRGAPCGACSLQEQNLSLLRSCIEPT